ncbi:MAG TPA: hypothetical protein VLN45_01115 [Ignavibacteriaceae bacterium]|nr:hypothetical protein [Ignavibacteriaceae bacterium]
MKYFSSLIFFLLFLNPTFAQDTSKTKCQLKHGIQFQMDGLINLRNFDGYTFSYRYLFNDNSGIRIGVNTSINNEDLDILQRVDSITNHPPLYSHNYSYRLSVQYLQSILEYYDFDLVIGGGSFFSFGKSESKQEYVGSSYSTKYSSKNESFGYGLDLIFGVEYKLASNIVLSGEYGITLENENSEIDYITTEINNGQTRIRSEIGDRDRFSLRGSSVNLGVAFFF